MIVVSVAEHKGVDLCRVELENGDIVIERLRHIAKIDQNVARLAPALRLRVHGKPPLADQVRAWRGVRAHITCGSPLDGKAAAFLRRDELYDLSVGDYRD